MDSSLAIEAVLDKLPVAQLDETLSDFIAPFAAVLPDARLRQVVPLAVRGIVAGESPIVTAMAQSVARGSTEEEKKKKKKKKKKKNAVWAAAKRIYRFLGNPRLSVDLLQEGLYERARATIEEEKPKRVVVALDPVNFEKPYTRKLEGVSTIYKSTPPDRHGKARLARGYPAITATVVNTRVPATTYANWFSYTTDFISENREIRRAIDSTRRVFPRKRLRFVGDSGLDDKKIFEWIASATEAEAEFVIRASHLNRRVEVYNRHLDRWESESLEELVRTVPFAATWQVAFTHAGKTRLAEVKVGWLRLRLPEETDQHQHQQLWAVVAEEYDVADKAVRTLVLLTSVPVVEVAQAQELYEDWRLRGRIEHGYRFCQEAGLDVEDMQVRSVGRMRRLFILVLLAAQFVMHLTQRWPATGVRWLRLLGGKLGLQIDRDGPYILLRGLSAVWQTVATLTHLAIYPFPHEEFR